MTHSLLPRMLRHKRGAIVNVSSYSGTCPVGLLSVYSATKSYVDYFSRSLQQEYGGNGIFIQSLTTMVVVTKMTDKLWVNSFSVQPGDYAREAVKTICQLEVTCGHPVHVLQSWAIQLLPVWLRDKMTFKVNLAVMKKAIRRNSNLATKEDNAHQLL